jgi:hypothetical protein
LVDKLEQLLVLARQGKLQAFGFVAVTNEHSTVHGRIEQDGYDRDIAVGIADLFFAHYAERDADHAQAEYEEKMRAKEAARAAS